MSGLNPVPLFGLGNQGKSPNVDAQKRLNLYVEVQQDGEKGGLTMYPTPGLVTFASLGAFPARGLYERSDALYAVAYNILYKILPSGAISTLGTINTYSGRVAMADNGTQLIIVDGSFGYIYNFNTLALTQITDPDFPGADTVTFFGGRFIVNKPASGQFWISDLYDGTSWNALNFATAESDPDNIVRVMADGGYLIIYGTRTTELWGDIGAADFPYGRVGSTTIEWGLAARWSLVKFMDSLIFLRKNRLGQVQVCVQDGMSSAPVSTPELDSVISAYANVSDATGFAYMLGGHPMYQINFPTANASWLYDGQSKSWSKLQYSTGGRHRGEIQAQMLGNIYVSDYANGKIYQVKPDTYTDDGVGIVREFITRHQTRGDFSSISQMWLEMEAGVGLQLGQGSAPQIMMQISRDGGHEWGAENWANIGAVGKYKVRAVWNRLGAARDWLFKFRVTDPVKTVFIAAWGKGD